MNKRQLIVMWIGIGIMVLIALIPPSKVHVHDKDEWDKYVDEVRENIEYPENATERQKGFIRLREFNKNMKSDGLRGDSFYHKAIRPVFLFSDYNDYGKIIQYGKMILCQFIVALITSGLIVTFKEKKAR